MTTQQIIDTAARHIGSGTMVSSAQLCLDDARALMTEGDAAAARTRALKSLSYSVGILHADYQRAIAE